MYRPVTGDRAESGPTSSWGTLAVSMYSSGCRASLWVHSSQGQWWSLGWTHASAQLQGSQWQKTELHVWGLGHQCALLPWQWQPRTWVIGGWWWVSSQQCVSAQLEGLAQVCTWWWGQQQGFRLVSWLLQLRWPGLAVGVVPGSDRGRR